MLDVKRKEEARGHRFRNGLAEVSELASPRWQVCVKTTFFVILFLIIFVIVLTEINTG